jgi:hypothetical protein
VPLALKKDDAADTGTGTDLTAVAAAAAGGGIFDLASKAFGKSAGVPC